MLSDEEKKAIEYLKQNNIVEIQYDNYGLESIHRVGIDEKQTILNLIEKQFKEIEELKNGQIDFWISDKEIEERIRNKFVSKDKIKAKIEEQDKIINTGGIDFNTKSYARCKKEVLQSLLEKE